MAECTEEQRLQIMRGLMRYWSNNFETIGDLNKAQLKAAIDATDTWIDDSQAAYNAALPLQARNELSLSQKTILFCAVALMRVGLGFLRQVFGEVD